MVYIKSKSVEEFLSLRLPTNGTFYIDLSNAKISSNDMSEIMQKLEGRKVYQLNLRNARLTDKTALLLAGALKRNEMIERVDLTFNNIGNEGATALAEVMKSRKVTIDGRCCINHH